MTIAMPEKGVTNGRNGTGLPAAGVTYGWRTLRVLIDKHTKLCISSVLLFSISRTDFSENLQGSYHDFLQQTLWRKTS